MNRLSVVPYEVRFCPICKGERPHSKRGRCLMLHRKSRLSSRPKTEYLDLAAAFRDAVLARDGHRCQRCGTRQHLEVHHRLPRGAGGSSLEHVNFGVGNGVTICRGCHNWAEQYRENAMGLGWLVTRFGDVDPADVPIHTINGWELLGHDGTRTEAKP